MRSRVNSVIIVSIITAIISVAVTRVVSRPQPVLLGEVSEYPEDVQHNDGWWYWIERPAKAQQQIVRGSGTTREVVAKADEITGYDVMTGSITVALRRGTNWIVETGPIKGARSPVWFGPFAAGRPKVSGNLIAWCVSQPGLLSSESPLPALAGTVNVMLRQDGKVRVLANLLESRCNVLSITETSLILSAERSKRFDVGSIYQVELATGKPRRLIAEQGLATPVVLKSGDVIFASRSQDSSMQLMTSCVRKVDTSGRVITLADWLPTRGALFVIDDIPYYVDRDAHAGAWRIRSNDRLSAPVLLANDFAFVAITKGEALVRRDTSLFGRQPIFLLRPWK